MISKDSVRVSFTISKDLYLELKKYCVVQCFKESKMISFIIRDYLFRNCK